MITVKDLIKKTDQDLQKLVIEKKTTLRDFYFGVAGGKVTNVKAARNLRKEIARLLTLLTGRGKKVKA